MNDEVKLLDSRIKPVLDKLAEGRFKFGPEPSELLAQFYEQDETAKYLFESFVALDANYENSGVFTITDTLQLEKIYKDPPARGQELLDNRIFIFALQGDGSFFGFGLNSRQIYDFDFCPWIGEEGPWTESLTDQWDVAGFCDYFEKEYALNSPQ